MTRALWLLLGLQCLGWFRAGARKLRTVKGALLGLVGVGIIVLWLWAVLLAPRTARASADPDTLRRIAPAAVLVYCLMTVLLTSGQRALYFSPAEITYLFAGPFTPRQLLVYKIVVSALVGLPVTVFLTLLLHIHSEWWLAAYLGLYLGFLFLQIFALGARLLIDVVGAHAYTRARRLFLLLLALVAAGVLFQVSRQGQGGRAEAILGLVEDSQAWKILSAPLGTFVETFLVSQGDWWGLLRWTGLSAATVLLFVGLALLLNTHYLESAAISSEKIYSLLQKMRSGEATGLNWPSSGKVRWGLPSLPWWGGIGPIAWRQATTGIRSLGRIALVVLMLAPLMIGPLFGGQRRDAAETGLFLLGLLIWLSLLLTTLVPYDFRGDLERMDVLKTLPLPPWRLVIGQLLVPVTILWILQTLCLITIGMARETPGWMLLTGALCAIPLNFLLFGLDNLLFLWFPSRVWATSPGDFQALGRNVLIILAKTLVLSLALGLSGGGGWLVYELTGLLLLGGTAGWVILSACAASLVPLVSLAFQGFDVSRDLPA